jgi:uncharacterized protein YcgI (DUF1989 family)
VHLQEEGDMDQSQFDAYPSGPRPATVAVKLDQQQRKLVELLRDEGTCGTTDGEIIRNAVLDYLEQQSQPRPATHEAEPERRRTAEPGNRRFDQTLQPVSGRAVPVYKGEVLRITQVEGEQCVDFNCFNLHDYKEYMHVGNMRREGFRTREGRIVWSNPPRYHPMMRILHMPETCVTDLLGARCSALLFEVGYGLEDHPNCQDTLAEAIREYGLGPADVHDSLNMWMNTEWDHIGFYIVRNTGRPGDYVDLLALMDVLAVPAVCGSGDLWTTSNFSYKPIRIEIFEPSDESSKAAEEDWSQHSYLRNQRTLADFRVGQIRTKRELHPVPGYEPRFPNFPIAWTDVDVEFTSDEYRRIWMFCGSLGDTVEEVVRTLFLHWYIDNRKKPALAAGRLMGHA